MTEDPPPPSPEREPNDDRQPTELSDEELALVAGGLPMIPYEPFGRYVP
jgi:hypothetical protein